MDLKKYTLQNQKASQLDMQEQPEIILTFLRLRNAKMLIQRFL